MKFESVVYCHWDLLRFMNETEISEKNNTLSLVAEGELELMIFLSKKNEGQGYEVRVYKTEMEFDEFSFDDFGSAREFMENIPYEHPEYEERPARKIDKKNYANM